MLKSFLKCPLLATALVAGAAQAQCLTFGEQVPVRNEYVDCLRTADWQEKPAAQPRAGYSALVLFAFERAELADEGRKVLDDLAQKLLVLDARSIAITAHADRIGDPDYNARLAARRAHAIRAYLVDKGVSEELFRFESKGSSEPVTARLCDAMGPEHKQNAKLIACLQPDRRAEIAIAGQRKPGR